MHTKFLIAAAAIALGAAPAMAVSAVTVVNGSCISVADANGCKFNGNIAPSTVADTQTEYNLYNNTHPTANPDIVLNYLGKSDSGFGTLTGTPGTSGTWATPGFLVDFLAVKAGNFFVLYKLAAPVSSGTWNTFNILSPGKNPTPLNLSHLAFFGGIDPNFDPDGGVPEPATWAMLLSGFGMIGFAARRRRGLANVSA